MIISKGFSVVKNCLRPESVPLNISVGYEFSNQWWNIFNLQLGKHIYELVLVTTVLSTLNKVDVWLNERLMFFHMRHQNYKKAFYWKWNSRYVNYFVWLYAIHFKSTDESLDECRWVKTNVDQSQTNVDECRRVLTSH